MQEEDADTDAGATTSEGVFVYDNGFGVAVNVGDVVRVSGDVAEFETSAGSGTDSAAGSCETVLNRRLLFSADSRGRLPCLPCLERTRVRAPTIYRWCLAFSLR